MYSSSADSANFSGRTLSLNDLSDSVRPIVVLYYLKAEATLVVKVFAVMER